MAPDQHKQQPPYVRITEHYRELIRSGELKAGDRLPSARQLVAEWRIAINTAAKVLSTLRTEGLVTTSVGGGGGTIVSAGGIGYAPRDRIGSSQKWGRIYPPSEHAKIKVAEVVAAPDHVADALGISPGAQAIRRHRVTFSGETPVSASTSWFAGHLAGTAPLLVETERIRQGTARYIEEMTGMRASRGRDQVTVGVADELVAADLGLPVGTPVLVGRNWFRAADGEVVEFGEHVSIKDRWQTYEYEIQ